MLWAPVSMGDAHADLSPAEAHIMWNSCWPELKRASILQRNTLPKNDGVNQASLTSSSTRLLKGVEGLISKPYD